MSVKRLPAEVFHPSEYIRDELEARGWTGEQFHIMAGGSRHEANGLVDGTLDITPRRALLLARAFGSCATTWYRMQRTFDAGMKAKKMSLDTPPPKT